MKHGATKVTRPSGLTRRGVLGGLTAGCAAPMIAGQSGITEVMGAKVAYEMRPGRSPTLVFESGLGDGLESWRPVLSRLDASIAYLAYDRPGYGGSVSVSSSGEPRDSVAATAFLHELLGALPISFPLILIGHSLGGLYITKYAADQPGNVAGLVFVDGRPPRFRALCDAAAVDFCSSRQTQTPPANWPAHIVAELNGLRATEDLAPDAAAIAGLPATVITSTRPWNGDQGAEGFELWLRSQRGFAEGFRDHRFVRAEGAGHYVHRDQPDLVVREIEAMHRRFSQRRGR